MKSIDELREYVDRQQDEYNNHNVSFVWQLSTIADEIEAEIADNYMHLPMDADGVPICVGDVVAAQDEQPFEVRAFQLDALGWFAIERLGSQWNVNQLHHVKPRTLEDVLRDCCDECYKAYKSQYTVNLADIHRKYADEIRELLGFEIDEPDTIRNELEHPCHIGELIIGR